MRRFTTEFGMGSGGSNALWSSSNSVAASGLAAAANWVCDGVAVLRASVRFASDASFRFVCRLQPSDTQTSNCLGVIWSSLTGN